MAAWGRIQPFALTCFQEHPREPTLGAQKRPAGGSNLAMFPRQKLEIDRNCVIRKLPI
jgi:hypothetical protein